MPLLTQSHPGDPLVSVRRCAIFDPDGIVTGRAKFVRPEFVEKIKQSTHWQHQQMVPNQLAEDVDIWS